MYAYKVHAPHRFLHVVEEIVRPVHAGIAGDKGSPLYSKELDVHGGTF